MTAACLIAAFLPSLFLLPAFAWQLVGVGVVVVCSMEWGRLCGLTHYRIPVFAAFVAAIFALVLSFPDFASWVYIASLLVWLIVFPVELTNSPRVPRRGLRLLAGAIVVLGAALALVMLRERSPSLLLALMGIVWISDSAAYFAGRRWGKHKLAPRISPGKTWEGAIGGLFAVLCYTILMHASFPDLPGPSVGIVHLGIGGAVMLWLALAVAGILGDLAESWAKRIAGVKDSGRILPGHGGMLDRVDALLPVLPIAALLYSL